MKLAEDLKKAVLQAAMQGKLTEQKDTDSSVDELLQKIVNEKNKQKLVWKAKKQPPIDELLETIDADNIPSNWRWVKLNEIAHSYIGLTYSPSNISSDGIIVLRSSNIQNGKIDYKDIVRVDMPIPDNKMCKKGDILVCARNGSKSLVGKCAIIDNDGMSFGAFMAIIKSPCNEYIYHYLSSPYFKKQMSLDSSTVTVNQITQDMLFNACVPLPPIEEQQRIVEKLNSILPLIDEYSKEEDELIDLCQKFPEEMKKSVLQAAMQGKLTEQKQDDSSVDELLQKITDEKEKLLKEGKIKKEKSLADITEDEIPFDIPENWRWVRFADIFYKITDGTHKTPKYTTSGIPFISVKNCSSGILDFSNIKFISEKEHQVLYSRCNPEKGDLLITKVGTTGIPVKIETDKVFDLFVSVALLKFSHHLLNIDYLYLALQSPDVYEQVKLNTKGVGNKNWVLDDIKATRFPLPPIEEQQRIVEKLNTILPIIDSMAVYGTKKKAGRPKEEEALAFINTLLNTTKKTKQKTDSSEIEMLKEKAKSELPEIVQNYAARMGLTYNRITIRHQKTRWGSCTKSGNLNFNCLLMKMPQNVRDYVIVHELAHRKELNHSSRFWSIVAQYCPDYKEATKWLKENGVKLI